MGLLTVRLATLSARWLAAEASVGRGEEGVSGVMFAALVVIGVSG